MDKTNRSRMIVAAVATFVCFCSPANAAHTPEFRKTVDQLATDTKGKARIVSNRATGVARFITLPAGSLKLEGGTMEARAIFFFESYGLAFGVHDPNRELEKVLNRKDFLGMTHISYRQVYEGVPVFATQIRAHFNSNEQLVTVNGTFIPNLTIDPSPFLSATEAAESARVLVAKDHGFHPAEMDTTPPELNVYREGLVRGIQGTDHLVWEVEVSKMPFVREFVYVDAHNGKIVDRIQGIFDLTRRIHHRTFPSSIWSEGDPLPFSGIDETKDAEINVLIESTKQTYDFYSNLSGGTYLSYDGNNRTMQAVYEATELECPNAQWNGTTVDFCNGLAVDDVIAHEWTHAYSQYTHDLIYQWQPGALNEAYSDIFGETVDLLNGVETGMPVPARSDGECSAYGGLPTASLEISAPSTVSGLYPAGDAVFNPVPPWDVSAQVELVDDGIRDDEGNTRSDGCDPPFEGFTSGRIALIDRGSCLFREKAVNAVDSGAVAVIVVNNQGDETIRMGGDLPRLGIPTLLIGQSDGDSLKAILDQGVFARLSQDDSDDQSARWLVSDDSTSGAFRDMWNPVCFSNPGKVSDSQYFCAEDDNGGVHINSGVPNHAYALLIDGGTFNGHTVAAIGLTKAAHIYWRAMSTYQVPNTGFAEHADMLELSCRDLIGAPLTDLDSGSPSSEVIDTNDCTQVAEAMLAVEMRRSPDQCGFVPVLAQYPPAVPAKRVVFSERFDSPTNPQWSVRSEGVFGEFDGRVWELENNLPADRDGGAFYAVNGVAIGNCVAGNNDQSGVMRLESPSITIPSDAAGTVLLFEHYLATEQGWDGGNVKISVNSGDYELVPAEAFLFNSYNGEIITANENGTNDNPLAGDPGFTGTDGGLLTGSWGQSQIDLESLAKPGDRIKIRFDFGSDGCSGVDGWYVDNFEILTTGGAVVRQAGGRRQP